MKTFAALTFAATVALTACSNAAHSSAPPGSPIITFPSSVDETFTTSLMSNPDAVQAGIDGRVLTVREYEMQKPIADDLTIDTNGNVGLRGALYIRSSRAEKTDIHRPSFDPLDVVSSAHVVEFRYRNEQPGKHEHVGLIAQDAPGQLAGPNRASVDLPNAVFINMAATKELLREVATLKREVRQLRAEVRESRRTH